MTVQEKMAQLQAVKADIKQALIDKGVDMTDVPFTEYAGKINSLSLGDYPGYELKTGEIGKLTATNNQTLSGEIPSGIIPLTLKLVHTGGESTYPCYIGLNKGAFGYAKGKNAGASSNGMNLFFDLEMAYGGIEAIQDYTHYGSHTTNANGTNTLSIVKWLE